MGCNLQGYTLSSDTLPPNTTIERNDAHGEDEETQGHGLPSPQSVNGPQCNQQPCTAHCREDLSPGAGRKAQQSQLFSYLGTRTTWSTAGPCSRQSSDIYTPNCIGVPSCFLWGLAAEKQHHLEQFQLSPPCLAALMENGPFLSSAEQTGLWNIYATLLK